MNKSFKARALTIAAILALTLVISGVVVAQGGNIFRNETTTAGGYSTWDSDMINVITSYSIHYTKLYDAQDTGYPSRKRPKACCRCPCPGR